MESQKIIIFKSLKNGKDTSHEDYLVISLFLPLEIPFFLSFLPISFEVHELLSPVQYDDLFFFNIKV